MGGELESSRPDYHHSDFQEFLLTSVHSSSIEVDVRAFHFIAKMEDQAALKSSRHTLQIKGYKLTHCHKHLSEEPLDLKNQRDF